MERSETLGPKQDHSFAPRRGAAKPMREASNGFTQLHCRHDQLKLLFTHSALAQVPLPQGTNVQGFVIVLHQCIRPAMDEMYSGAPRAVGAVQVSPTFQRGESTPSSLHESCRDDAIVEFLFGRVKSWSELT